MEIKLSLLLLVTVLIKVVSCEWVLDVQLFNYQNPRNVEPRESSGSTRECCCDTFTCALVGQTLNSCPAACDIFFNVELSACQQPSNCLISTMDETVTDSASDSAYGYIFSFSLETIPDDLTLTIEMKDESTANSNGDIVDIFEVPVNLSGERDTVMMTGSENIATITLRYELTCTDSTCQQPVSTPTPQVMDPVQCTSASFTAEVKTTTITSTVIMSPCPQDGSVVNPTETVTVSRISTTTMIVTQTPENVGVSQSSQSAESAWMAVAVIFIIIAIVGITLSAILGCILYKRRKTTNKPTRSTHGNGTRNSVQESGMDNPMYTSSLKGSKGEPEPYYEFGPTHMVQSNVYEQPCGPGKGQEYEVPMSSYKGEQKL